MNQQTQTAPVLQDEDWEALDNDPVENLKAIEAFAARETDRAAEDTDLRSFEAWGRRQLRNHQPEVPVEEPRIRPSQFPGKK